MKRYGLLFVTTLFLLVAALYRPTPPSLCFSRSAAGIACPGCGLVRSVTSLARGNWNESIRYHLFGPLVLAVGVVLWGISIQGLIRGRSYRMPDSPQFHSLLVVMFVLFIGYWLARLGTGNTP